MVDKISTQNQSKIQSKQPLTLHFQHPDLGIGGAERLIVDACTLLTQLGHKVQVLTSYHDKDHAFEETLNGSFKVSIRGDSLVDKHIGGKFKVVCAWLRALHACVAWETLRKKQGDKKPDVVIVDQVSAAVPLLRWLGYKVLFYCHYPDKLLTGRETLLKSLYRYPIDQFEEWTTGQSNKILVNSRFTLSIFSKAFPNIQLQPHVLYPGINTKSYDVNSLSELEAMNNIKPLLSNKKTILSINRFERKKNVALAIQAFAELGKRDNQDVKFEETRLIIAGGYDPANKENVEHLKELEQICDGLSLRFFTYWNDSTSSPPYDIQVLFLPSFTTSQRNYLLRSSTCLLYTPTGEHFGIVPVEAMYSQLPVIAANSGGPKETIVHNVTGYLASPQSPNFADYIKLIFTDENKRLEMGKNGRARVLDFFTEAKFESQLEDEIWDLYMEKEKTLNPLSVIYALFFWYLFYPWVCLGFY